MGIGAQGFCGRSAALITCSARAALGPPENGGVFLEIVNPLATSSHATGINDLEQVCGFYVDSGGATHGFLLNAGTLTKLDFPGASGFTQALGLNNEGRLSESTMWYRARPRRRMDSCIRMDIFNR